MLLNPGQKISANRERRIINVVAPLVAQGCSIDHVASVVGYTRAMAGKDMEVVRQWWEETASQTAERWRGTCRGRPEHLYREALVGWEESKRAGTQGRLKVRPCSPWRGCRHWVSSAGLTASDARNRLRCS